MSNFCSCLIHVRSNLHSKNKEIIISKHLHHNAISYNSTSDVVWQKKNDKFRNFRDKKSNRIEKTLTCKLEISKKITRQRKTASYYEMSIAFGRLFKWLTADLFNKILVNISANATVRLFLTYVHPPPPFWKHRGGLATLLNRPSSSRLLWEERADVHSYFSWMKTTSLWMLRFILTLYNKLESEKPTRKTF